MGTTGDQWHLQSSAPWFEMTVVKMKNNIRCQAWDDKKISKRCTACLYFCEGFTENFIYVILGLSILNQNQSTDYTLPNPTPTVVHVLSLTPVDPNKSPLYPSIQGLRAATPRARCLRLRKLPDDRPLCPRRPTHWTHFSIFSPLSSITNPSPPIALGPDLYMH